MKLQAYRITLKSGPVAEVVSGIRLDWMLDTIPFGQVKTIERLDVPVVEGKVAPLLLSQAAGESTGPETENREAAENGGPGAK